MVGPQHGAALAPGAEGDVEVGRGVGHHLDAGRDLLVPLLHDVDDVGAVGRQQAHVGPRDPLRQRRVRLLDQSEVRSVVWTNHSSPGTCLSRRT